MLTVDDIKPRSRLAAAISATFAIRVLHIFEDRYPNDSVPRAAIVAAMEWINNPSAANTSIALSAADLSYSIANRVNGPRHKSDDAAAAAYYTSTAAADGGYEGGYGLVADVNAPAVAATYVTHYAAESAACASGEEHDNREPYIHKTLLNILPLILEYKINNEEPFGNPEKVFEYLNKEQQEQFIYNLDILKK